MVCFVCLLSLIICAHFVVFLDLPRVSSCRQYFDLNVSLSVSFILSNLCADGRSVCARTAITQMVITFQQSCLFGWKKKTIVKHKCEQYKQTHTFTHASTSRQRKTVNRCEYD